MHINSYKNNPKYNPLALVEPEEAPALKLKDRKCLMCADVFQSKGPHNRRCIPCNIDVTVDDLD